MSKADGTETKISFLISAWLYPSLCWDDAETDDQHTLWPVEVLQLKFAKIFKREFVHGYSNSFQNCRQLAKAVKDVDS